MKKDIYEKQTHQKEYLVFLPGTCQTVVFKTSVLANQKAPGWGCFEQRTWQGRVPPTLRDKRVLSLDLALLLAGTRQDPSLPDAWEQEVLKYFESKEHPKFLGRTWGNY